MQGPIRAKDHPDDRIDAPHPTVGLLRRWAAVVGLAGRVSNFPGNNSAD